MKSENRTNSQLLTIVREFDASQKDVFNAFSDADALNEWWGPVETRNSVISLDFKPGGIFHYKMDYEGNVNYGRFVFGQISLYDLLEFTNAFSDEYANAVRAPFDIPLPLEIFYRLRFSEDNGRTTIIMTAQPVNGTPEEEEAFGSINESMQQGFAGTYNKLETYLNKIRP